MTTKSELQQQVISLYEALKELEPDTKRDASIFQQAIDNKDWVGPASHFMSDSEVIQVQTLRGLLKGSLRKGDTIGNLVLVPEETAELALFPQNQRSGWLRLTLRSGVSVSNDNVVGDFKDERTAVLIGNMLLAIDKNDHPEYSHFTTDPAE